MKEVPALSGQSLGVSFTVEEGEVTTHTGQINGDEVSVRRFCVKCYAWQAEFDGNGK